jgi:phenylacetate-CoA ligase
MNERLLQVYHRLPGPARSTMASARGLYLRAWRYGPETDQLVAEALERESWPPGRLQAWQQARLAEQLHRAATRVPYYRALWRARRLAGDRRPWDVLAHWPVLGKTALRQAPRAFVADDCDVRRMFHEHTSGTTGTPVSIWFSRATVRRWYALFEARWRRWNGVSRHDPWAIMGGQLVAPVGATRPPFWVWNAPLHQLYLSSYHLAPRNIGAYADALRRSGVRYALGYASSLAALAGVAEQHGVALPQLRVVLSNAEPFYAHQREAVSRAFGAPARDTYGMTEIACAASECDRGTLHLWPEVGVVEVLEDGTGEAAPAGCGGRLVCTSLLNPDMPLVRYEVGDRGALGDPSAACACGRGLPAIGRIEGRCDDVLVTRDGRLVGRLDPVFKLDLPIREAQIVQEAADRVRVAVVPAAGYCAADGESIAARLRQRLGDVDVTIDLVAGIPRSANGKFRAVVRSMPLEQPGAAPAGAPERSA